VSYGTREVEAILVLYGPTDQEARCLYSRLGIVLRPGIGPPIQSPLEGLDRVRGEPGILVRPRQFLRDAQIPGIVPMEIIQDLDRFAATLDRSSDAKFVGAGEGVGIGTPRARDRRRGRDPRDEDENREPPEGAVRREEPSAPTRGAGA
jgi:hypothetical protein